MRRVTARRWIGGHSARCSTKCWPDWWDEEEEEDAFRLVTHRDAQTHFATRFCACLSFLSLWLSLSRVFCSVFLTRIWRSCRRGHYQPNSPFYMFSCFFIVCLSVCPAFLSLSVFQPPFYDQNLNKMYERISARPTHFSAQPQSCCGSTAVGGKLDRDRKSDKREREEKQTASVSPAFPFLFLSINRKSFFCLSFIALFCFLHFILLLSSPFFCSLLSGMFESVWVLGRLMQPRSKVRNGFVGSDLEQGAQQRIRTWLQTTHLGRRMMMSSRRRRKKRTVGGGWWAAAGGGEEGKERFLCSSRFSLSVILLQPCLFFLVVLCPFSLFVSVVFEHRQYWSCVHLSLSPSIALCSGS